VAETVVRVIGALFQVVAEFVVQHTGRKVLSLWGRKSNAVVEFLIGLLVWSIVLVALVEVLTAKQ
jgi:hypothetical protein